MSSVNRDDESKEPLRYRRSRFSTRLTWDRLYTASHYWLKRGEGSVWRVGLTRFAKRMLGEIVEFDFDVQVNERVAVGQVIGWIEAFKAVSDVYCTLDGEFLGANPNLEDDPSLLDSDPEADGWIYSVDGAPDEACVDALGYSRILDQQIDRMTGKAE